MRPIISIVLSHVGFNLVYRLKWAMSGLFTVRSTMQTKSLAVEMNVSKCSLNCVLWEDLHVDVYRRHVSYLLDARQKIILFTDKKIFNRGEIQSPKLLCICQKLLQDQKKIPRFRGVTISSTISNGLVGSLYFGATHIHFCNASLKDKQ